MTRFVNEIRAALNKRARYNRTRAELRSMPLATMIDFDLAPNEVDRIARNAVYGT